MTLIVTSIWSTRNLTNYLVEDQPFYDGEYFLGVGTKFVTYINYSQGIRHENTSTNPIQWFTLINSRNETYPFSNDQKCRT